MKKIWLNYLIIPMGLALLYLGVSIIFPSIFVMIPLVLAFISIPILFIVSIIILNTKTFKHVGIFIVSIVFTFSIYQSYQKLGMTHLGVIIFNPTHKKNVEDHFLEKYGLNFIITRAFYSYRGDVVNGGKWYPTVKGYLKEDPGSYVNLEFYNGKIHDNYNRYRRTIFHYYKKNLKELIPWEFNLEIIPHGIYSKDTKKSYREVLESKDSEIVSSLNISIYMSSKILEEYSFEEYQKITLRVAKEIYRINSHLEDNSSISFWVIDAPKEKINKHSVYYLKDNYNVIEKYSSYIKTRFLTKDFFEIKNYNEMEEYMKKRYKVMN